MQTREMDENDIKRIFDSVLEQPSFLIYQQQRLIAEAKRKIRIFELYKKSNIAMVEDGSKKLEACEREIINAKNQIVLRQNFIEYLKGLDADESIEKPSVEFVTDPLAYYIERLILADDVIDNPMPIVDASKACE